mgnify:CR=1 FL=1
MKVNLSDTETLFNILVKTLALDKTFAANPKNEGATTVFCHFVESVDADTGVGGCLFQSQVLLFPNGDFLHRLSLLKSIFQLIVVAADIDPLTIMVLI